MKKITLVVVLALLSGCTGGPCNPPPILYPVLIPLAIPVVIANRVRDHNKRTDLKPIVGGDSVEQPFVLHGRMTAQDLQLEEYLGYWSTHHFRAPGVGVRWSSAVVKGRTIHAVVFSDWSSSQESCYYFDVTDVSLIEKQPGQSTEPALAPKP
jgi:hypothetical protein